LPFCNCRSAVCVGSCHRLWRAGGGWTVRLWINRQVASTGDAGGGAEQRVVVVADGVATTVLIRAARGLAAGRSRILRPLSIWASPREICAAATADRINKRAHAAPSRGSTAPELHHCSRVSARRARRREFLASGMPIGQMLRFSLTRPARVKERRRSLIGRSNLIVSHVGTLDTSETLGVLGVLAGRHVRGARPRTAPGCGEGRRRQHICWVEPVADQNPVGQHIHH